MDMHGSTLVYIYIYIYVDVCHKQIVTFSPTSWVRFPCVLVTFHYVLPYNATQKKQLRLPTFRHVPPPFSSLSSKTSPLTVWGKELRYQKWSHGVELQGRLPVGLWASRSGKVTFRYVWGHVWLCLAMAVEFLIPGPNAIHTSHHSTRP